MNFGVKDHNKSRRDNYSLIIIPTPYEGLVEALR
jgi:hypothetical protein